MVVKSGPFGIIWDPHSGQIYGIFMRYSYDFESMVLVYMLTKRGYIDGIHVTMDPMGYDFKSTDYHRIWEFLHYSYDSYASFMV